MEPEDVSISATFSDLGVDSFLGLRFSRLLHDATGVKMELEWAYDYPTIESLAGCIRENQTRLDTTARLNGVVA